MDRIIIIGGGYVGLAHACLFQKNKDWIVELVEINQDKVSSLENGISYINEKEIVKIVKDKPSNLIYNTKLNISSDTIAIFIALPTDSFEGNLCTELIENVLKNINISNIPIVIKSTVPIGFSKSLNRFDIVFSPEFLREGNAIHDLSNPSRLVIGCENHEMLLKVEKIYKKVVPTPFPILHMGYTEAEAVKLFSNTYLALRVAFFNEVDTFSIENGLDVENIIMGMGLDYRIGKHYNNPSFGYGGYCLPKDVKQAHKLVNSPLIKSIKDSNQYRKEYLAQYILKRNIKSVGVFNFAMKFNSDNDRESALFDVVNILKEHGIHIYMYNNSNYPQFENISHFDEFVGKSDIILTNRMTKELESLKYKVITRDLFGKDE